MKDPIDRPPERDAFSRGSPGADASIVYEPDERGDAEGDLHGALYGYEADALPLFAGLRDERPSAPRRSDDLPDDLDPLVDGADLGLAGLADLEDL